MQYTDFIIFFKFFQINNEKGDQKLNNGRPKNIIF